MRFKIELRSTGLQIIDVKKYMRRDNTPFFFEWDARRRTAFVECENLPADAPDHEFYFVPCQNGAND